MTTGAEPRSGTPQTQRAVEDISDQGSGCTGRCAPLHRVTIGIEPSSSGQRTTPSAFCTSCPELSIGAPPNPTWTANSPSWLSGQPRDRSDRRGQISDLHGEFPQRNAERNPLRTVIRELYGVSAIYVTALLALVRRCSEDIYNGALPSTTNGRRSHSGRP